MAGPITEFYGIDAAGEFGLYPLPPVIGQSPRTYEFVGDAGSNWKKLGSSAKGFDKVGHAAIAGTITKIAFAAEVDPGATEVRVLKNGTSAVTHTFTNKTGVATVSIPVADGDEVIVEARNVSDPKAKEITVGLS